MDDLQETIKELKEEVKFWKDLSLHLQKSIDSANDAFAILANRLNDLSPEKDL